MSIRSTLLKFLPFRRRLRREWNRIRPLPRIALQRRQGAAIDSAYTSPVEPDNLLENLGRKYKPTKRIHDYLKYYHLHFSGIRHQVRAFLEIGVDSGQSLLMWEEYFPNATIHGIDIESHCKKHAGGRKVIHIGNASDLSFMAQVVDSEPNGFDVAIDDGSHMMEDQLTAFNYLLPRLTSHGIYVIEDTGACAGDVGGRVVGRVATLIPRINFWPKQMPVPWPPAAGTPSQNWMEHFPENGHWPERNIAGISFYRWMVFVQRGNNPGDNPLFRVGGT
jgi:hypothetical protein